MQASARTPNSILRKRIDKENEDATVRIKRNRVANRRVSFAPDDELETKHIFKEDSDRNSTGELPTARGLCPSQVVAAAVAPIALVHGQLGGDPLAVLPSPENFSPLSMELTNTSLQEPCAVIVPAPCPGSMKGTFIGGPGADPSLQQQHQMHHHQHGPYSRMDITMNVPNLSTLVEEDEEEYGSGDVSNRLGSEADASPSLHRGMIGVGSGNLPSDSPMSPHSMRAIQMCCDSNHPDAQEEEIPLQKDWGYPTGEDDTCGADYGRMVMGERTYNHVYGTGTYGEMTCAIHDGCTTGGDCLPVRGAPAAGSAAAAHGTAAAAPATCCAAGGLAACAGPVAAALVGPVAAEPVPYVAPSVAPIAQLPPRQAPLQPHQHQHTEKSAIQPLQPLNVPAALAPQSQPHTRIQVHSTPFVDNTTKLLQDDQTEAWLLPGLAAAYDNRGRLSVASNRVLAPGARRCTGGAGVGETTMLLGCTMALASAGNGNTVQLLADTTTHRGAFERLAEKIPVRQGSPSTVPPPRPGAVARTQGPIAASSAADDQSMAMYGNARNSMEFKLGGGGDLLEDGGLTLDAHFQMPPEPTMTLSQLAGKEQAQQRPAQVGGGEMALSRAAGISEAHGGGMQAAARALPSRLSCQEFLGLIDVSFVNRVCRDTFVPDPDPLPKNPVEVYRAATCTRAYVEVYHAQSLDLAARLANIGTRITQLEAELTAEKQELFTAVQMLPAAELEIVKEKFGRLKELCRVRTVEQVKQAQLEACDEHLARLALQKQQLYSDVEAVKADEELLRACAEEASSIPLAITLLRQEAERAQEALQLKRTLRSRIQALRAQNAERQRRLDAAQADRQAKIQSRPPMPNPAEHRLLEERAAELRDRVNTNAMTPGREGQLIRQAARQADTVDAILALHSLRLDIRSIEHTGTFRMIFRRAYSIVCTVSNSFIDIQVACQDATAASLDGLVPSLRDRIHASSSALSCTIPRAHLPLQLGYILEQLQRMCRIVQQLESCWMRFPCLLQPHGEMVPAAMVPAHQGARAREKRSESEREGESDQGSERQREHESVRKRERQGESEWECERERHSESKESERQGENEHKSESEIFALVLRFRNPDTVTGVTIRMPWSEVLRSDYVRPRMSVEMMSLDPPDTQRQYCDALWDTVLRKLGPSTGYLTAVCYAMSETLHVPADGA